jgi:hypothetical protein
MTLRLFRYRILLTCAGAALGYFALGNNDLGSTSIFAIVLAALAFSLGYLIDSVAARLTPIQSGPYAIAQGYRDEHQEALRRQFTEFEESFNEDPDDAFDSPSLSLFAHGCNPNRGNGRDH